MANSAQFLPPVMHAINWSLTMRFYIAIKPLVVVSTTLVVKQGNKLLYSEASLWNLLILTREALPRNSVPYATPHVPFV